MSGQPLLAVRGLTKRYFGLTAVDDLSYDVEAGSIVGLIGPIFFVASAIDGFGK